MSHAMQALLEFPRRENSKVGRKGVGSKSSGSPNCTQSSRFVAQLIRRVATHLSQHLNPSNRENSPSTSHVPGLVLETNASGFHANFALRVCCRRSGHSSVASTTNGKILRRTAGLMTVVWFLRKLILHFHLLSYIKRRILSGIARELLQLSCSKAKNGQVISVVNIIHGLANKFVQKACEIRHIDEFSDVMKLPSLGSLVCPTVRPLRSKYFPMKCYTSNWISAGRRRYLE